MSVVTNLLALLLVGIGAVSGNHIIWNIGIFALSGAMTNWLAVYMLFEKVPGLYGSGVIPARFEAFKQAIADLMMEQFFTEANIDKFLSRKSDTPLLDVKGLLGKLDLAPAFDALVSTVAQSSFGGMLSMFGGTDALMPMKAPFIEKMQQSLKEIADSEQFTELLRQELEKPGVMADMRGQIQQIVAQRLEELTPKMVKEMVQTMIRRHLGWLVVWGGVFGGVIGLLNALFLG
ncbi:DUF445 family protein [Shewanella yunxiaonensis]|uniref:DUF445 family protein n=1 Tax=Shewanella yunxiaonensis TaxID=2829809 RepID=A0ABX7YY31_9GAMM|nr:MULTISPECIES: DUF445 family protein [Shewanella]MDF0533711.1 DUF445 family protein [Shewanella sp. A32]QUN07602.1 DUF445 family protein [Shewanella yunxiaonensis]